MQWNFLSSGEKDIHSRDMNYVWHPFTPFSEAANVIPVVKGKGSYLYTEDGKKILDGISSWWVNIHGHSNEYIADAINKQARELAHTIFAGFTHAPAVNLAERLINILPGQLQKVFYSDNGSTSVEVAMKMALQFWHNKDVKKQKIIALEDAYHGDTFGAMAAGARSLFTRPFHSLLFDVTFVDVHQDRNKVIEDFRAACDDDTAAFIYEPLLQGSAGMKIYPAELLNELIGIAKKQDILCIADEVLTGFGRTGKNFASEHMANKPDIICLSKGITGGTLPLGVTACSAKVHEAFEDSDRMKTFFHGHSYTANPIACAAANASMDLLLKDETQKKIREISRHHGIFLMKIEDHKKVLSAKTLGTVISITLQPEDTGTYLDKIRSKCYKFFLKKNILLRPLGNVIYIMPPYTIEKKELVHIYDSIEEFLEFL